jgi:hypothetical protein
MSQYLRDALHDLADEVRVVKLRDRSIQTSRRITRRYVAAGVACVVVAVAAITTGALALRPSASTPPVHPAAERNPDTHAQSPREFQRDVHGGALSGQVLCCGRS